MVEFQRCRNLGKRGFFGITYCYPAKTKEPALLCGFGNALANAVEPGLERSGDLRRLGCDKIAGLLQDGNAFGLDFIRLGALERFLKAFPRDSSSFRGFEVA